MKLPRDVSGAELLQALRRLGYVAVRQSSSYVRITTQRNAEHHEVIPVHNELRARNLSSILKSVAGHHQMTVEELLGVLDLVIVPGLRTRRSWSRNERASPDVSAAPPRPRASE